VSGVVVDTSVWIDFFAGRPSDRLEDALRAGAVLVPPIVVAELLSGTQRAVDRQALVALLQDLALCETPLAHWLAVGDLRRTVQRRGLTVSTPDAHIAQCAIDAGAVLLSRDAVFSRMARLVDLRVVT
jgi:predicted nucleic acid-binding protein